MTDSGQWRILKETVEKGVPGAKVGSTYRPGSQGSNGPDFHSKGQAVDIGGPMQQVFEWLITNYPGSEEIIYTPGGSRQIKNGQPHVYSPSVAAGHFDHVHWAATDLTAASHGQIPQGTAGSSVDSLLGLGSVLTFFSNPAMWLRVGAGIGGAILLLLSVGLLTGNNLIKALPLDALKGLARGRN